MRSRWPGLGRACAFLLASWGLCACVAQPGSPGYPSGPGSPGYASGSPTAGLLPSPAGRRIAVLVPLSGSGADLGQSMLKAARLALEAGVPGQFDSSDTKGTPEGAAAAADAAVAAGAGIIVGPLTAAETAAVAPVARGRGVPVLAFTSDPTKSQPGIWPMGLTPGQQVQTLVRAVRADNRTRIGAVLPRNPFGEALANGLLQAAQDAALPPPQIVRYAPGGLSGALTQIAGTPPSQNAAQAAPPIEALLVAETADVMLRALPTLVGAGLGPDKVRLLGTALWAQDAARLAPLAGAWFAAPNPQTMQVFEQNYMAHYGTPPRNFASIAFDAAGAAKAVTGPGGVDVNVLINPRGFSGANGVFVLLPDGRMRRSLALFEIGAGGARLRDNGLDTRQPAPSVM